MKKSKKFYSDLAKDFEIPLITLMQNVSIF